MPLSHGKTQLGSVPAGWDTRISWPEDRTLFAPWGLALAGDIALRAEYVHPLALGGLRQLCSGSRGGQSPWEGRGAGNSAQGVTEVTEESVSGLAL